MDSFVVDRGHPNGPEIHSVTDTGIIVVHRPGQIKRYYNAEGRNAPQDILTIAKEHLKKDTTTYSVLREKTKKKQRKDYRSRCLSFLCCDVFGCCLEFSLQNEQERIVKYVLHSNQGAIITNIIDDIFFCIESKFVTHCLQ